MQKWYVEDYLTHKCVKNTGDRPQYFVEDDHDPIVPKAVFYQVQGEKKRRSGLAKGPSKLRFGNRLALNGRLICGKCGRTLKRYVKAQEDLTDWRCRQRALDENGRIERFNNDLVIRYLDRVIVKDDGYEVIFKAGARVEVEV